MKRFIAGLIGVAGIFLATQVYAAGTATMKIDTANITTLTLGSSTTGMKFPAMTDNESTKFDSGALTITQGSQTVTTSLTAVDRVFTQIDGMGSYTAIFVATPSGAGFTAQGYLAGTSGTKYVGTASGYWFAIDE